MSMGGMGTSNTSNSTSSTTSANTCKISMLWNWYTIDTCFIARSWRCDTKGKFAGSCIGCFALVVVAQWLNRLSRQFDVELVKRHKLKYLASQISESAITSDDVTSEFTSEDLQQITRESQLMTTMIALQRTFSHTWYFNFCGRQNNNQDDALEKSLSCCSSAASYQIYPTLLDHIVRVTIFVLQWGLSYIIMLLFMYYNGYIIISCIIGAIVGRFLFNYEPLGTCGGSSGANGVVAHDREENDRKCCM